MSVSKEKKENLKLIFNGTWINPKLSVLWACLTFLNLSSRERLYILPGTVLWTWANLNLFHLSYLVQKRPCGIPSPLLSWQPKCLYRAVVYADDVCRWDQSFREFVVIAIVVDVISLKFKYLLSFPFPFLSYVNVRVFT